MTTWWEHVLRFSRRDQLSFGVAMAASDLRLHSVPLPNLRSPLHRWPEGRETRRRRPGRATGGRRRHAADPAALRAEIEAVLDDASDPHAWVWDLEARMTAATANVRRLRDQIQRHRGSSDSGVRCRP